MNSLHHGLRARTVVLPAENPEEFHQLCNDLEAEWQPQLRTEKFYVEQMAVSQWKLTRVEVAEKSILNQEARATFQIPLIDKLWQCQHRLERSYARAQRELERLQNSRRDQVHQPEEPVPASQQEARPASAAASAVAPQPQPARKTPHVMPSPARAAAAPSAAPSPRVEPRGRTAAS